jgi:hypothetical protein
MPLRCTRRLKPAPTDFSHAKSAALRTQIVKTLTIVRVNVYNTPTMSKFLSQHVTRRQALEILGFSAAAAALRKGVFAQTPTLPKDAIIRTVPPDVLGRRLERLREDVDGVPAQAEGRRRE